MNRLLALQADTVIVADDHPLFRTAIKEALEANQGETTFLEASSFESLQKLVDENQDVDLVLLDLHMPGVTGFAGLVYLCTRYPSVPVVIISATEDPVVIQRALEHGAAGFIPKSSSIETITGAIDQVLMGEIWVPTSVQSNLPGSNDSELELAERMAQVPTNQLVMLKLLCNQTAENMGLASSRLAGTLFDGIARHTQEGLDFVRRAGEVGFREAVRERDDPFEDYGSRPRR